DAIAAHGFFEHLEVVARDLMTEPARATMHHHDDLLVAGDPEHRSRDRIEYPFVRDHLDFKIVIARAQGPQLVDASLDRMVGHDPRLGALTGTPFLRLTD